MLLIISLHVRLFIHNNDIERPYDLPGAITVLADIRSES